MSKVEQTAAASRLSSFREKRLQQDSREVRGSSGLVLGLFPCSRFYARVGCHRSVFSLFRHVAARCELITDVVTFLMVFLIQNAQNRDTEVIILKLDWSLRGVKGARTSFIGLDKVPARNSNRLKRNSRACAKATRRSMTTSMTSIRSCAPGGKNVSPDVGID